MVAVYSGLPSVVLIVTYLMIYDLERYEKRQTLFVSDLRKS